MTHNYYPVSLDVRSRPCVVVGAGQVALGKITGLVDAGAHLTVIAPQAHPTVEALAANGAVRWLRREFQPGDLSGAFLVVAATNTMTVNQAAQEEAEAGGALINVVDFPSRCNYITPSIVRRGPLTLAISTEGVAPALAAVIRQFLERVLAGSLGDFLDQAQALRRRVQQGGESAEQRKTRWYRLVRAAAPLLLGTPPRPADAEQAARLGAGNGWAVPALQPPTTQGAGLGVVGADVMDGVPEVLVALQAALGDGESLTAELLEQRAPGGRPLFEGVLILNRGDRGEVYYQTGFPRKAPRLLHTLLARRSGLSGRLLARHGHACSGGAVVTHLFQVAAGLRSAAPLDAGVRGALRRAVDQAAFRGALPALLEKAVLGALAAGQHAYRDGSRGLPGDLPSLAVQWLAGRVPAFEGCAAVVLGDAEWSGRLARLLARSGLRTECFRAVTEPEDLGTACRAVLAGKATVSGLVLLMQSTAPVQPMGREDVRSLQEAAAVPLWVLELGAHRVLSPGALPLHGLTVWSQADLADPLWAEGPTPARVAEVRGEMELAARNFLSRTERP